MYLYRLYHLRSALFGVLALFTALLLLGQPARALDLSIDGNLRFQCGTATASAGAATLNNKCGVITTESLTTVAGSPYTLTLTNSSIAATDIVHVMVGNGTNTQGGPYVQRVTPGAGSAVVVVTNNATGTGGASSAGALNGTLTLRFLVVKP